MRIITASLNFLFLFCIGLSWSDTQTCLLGYKSTFQKLAKRNNANHFKDCLGNWNGSTINIHPIPTLPLNIRYIFYSAKKIRYLFSVFQNQNGVFELEVSSITLFHLIKMLLLLLIHLLIFLNIDIIFIYVIILIQRKKDQDCCTWDGVMSQNNTPCYWPWPQLQLAQWLHSFQQHPLLSSPSQEVESRWEFLQLLPNFIWVCLL